MNNVPTSQIKIDIVWMAYKMGIVGPILSENIKETQELGYQIALKHINFLRTEPYPEDDMTERTELVNVLNDIGNWTGNDIKDCAKIAVLLRQYELIQAQIGSNSIEEQELMMQVVMYQAYQISVVRPKEPKQSQKVSIGMWKEERLKSLRLKSEGRYWEWAYRYKKFDFQ